MRSSLTNILLTGVVLLMVGCADKAASPKAAFEKLVAAIKSGDEAALLAVTDKETGSAMVELLALAESPGNGIIKNPISGFKDATFTYGAETVDGDKGTLEVRKDGFPHTYQFVHEGGSWKLSIPELPEVVAIFEKLLGKGSK